MCLYWPLHVDSAADSPSAHASTTSTATRPTTRQSLKVPQVQPGNIDCVFCGKAKRRLPGKKNQYQTTSLCQSENAAVKILLAADLRDDERVKIAVGALSSLISREVRYHKLCYNEFTRQKSLDALAKTKSCKAESNISDVEANFFALLESQLIKKKMRLCMADLKRQCDSCFSAAGVLSNVRKDRLKAHIKRHFGESVQFIRPSRANEPEQVFATQYSQELLRESVSQHRHEGDDSDDCYSCNSDDSDDDGDDDGDDRSDTDVANDDCAFLIPEEGAADSHGPPAKEAPPSSTPDGPLAGNECGLEEWRIIYHAALIIRREVDTTVSTGKKSQSGE